LLREVLRRNRTIPGVEETAVSDRAAFPRLWPERSQSVPLFREGQDLQRSQPPLIDTSIVSPDYFHLLGMTLLRDASSSTRTLKTRPDRSDQPGRRAHVLAGKMGRARTGRQRVRLLGHLGVAGRTGPPRRRHCDAAQNRSRTPAFRRSTSTSTSAPQFLRSTCVDSRSRRHLRAGAHTSPGRRSGASRLPAETLDDVLSSSLLCGGSPVKWWRCLPQLPCCSPGLGIYGTISFWSMSNRARSPFASRWARKARYPQDGFTPGLTLAAAAPRSWLRLLVSSHGRPALRCLALRSPLRRRTPCSPPSPSPPVTSLRCAPCARSDHHTPRRMIFGNARDLSSHCCHPNDLLRMLMNHPTASSRGLVAKNAAGPGMPMSE